MELFFKTILLCCVFVFSFSETGQRAVSAIPNKLKYLEFSLYPIFKNKIPPPPKAGSSLQKASEAEVTKWQIARTPEICDIAKKEARDVSFENLFGSILNSNLDLSQKKIFSEFYDQIRDEADYFIQNLKKDYTRPRPFSEIKGIVPCVPTEPSAAYPSGHGALTKIEALVLSDIFPKKRTQLEKKAQEIGLRRVQIGVHYASDIESGRQWADLIYAELKKSKKYQERYKKLLADLKLKTQ